MTLRPTILSDLLEVVDWRAAHPERYRTAYPISAEMQADYWRTVVNVRGSRTRLWTAVDEKPLAPIAVGGVEGIEWENRRAELYLVMRPDAEAEYFRPVLDAVLGQAWNTLGLEHVHTEVYACAVAWLSEWSKLATNRGWYTTRLPARKCWVGRIHDAFYVDMTP